MFDAFGLYRPRRTPLHLLPAWVKVLLLCAAGIAVLIARGNGAALVGLAASLVVLASTLPPRRPTLRGLAPIAMLAALTGGYQWFRGDRVSAGEYAADLVALACLALALTTSTPLDEAMGLVAGAARPFRRVISPEAVGLVFATTMRAIPQVTLILRDSAEAARARGLGRSLRATLVPATVRTFGWGLALGDAMTARGLADPLPVGATSTAGATGAAAAR